MVNFSSLMGGSGSGVPVTLEATFQNLDRKTTHVDLRPGQLEVLRELHQSLDERDMVMRVSTGAGKTIVALVYLYHLMRRDGAPSVYLVPTTQLVEQVLREATNIGVPAYAYAKGEPIPHDECTRSEAVIVCTYDKLFNGRSTFLRSDVGIEPNAIVLDDVHAGIEVIRSCYSARIEGDGFKELRAALSSAMRAQAPGVWKGVMDGDDIAIVDIPFWIWLDNLQQIRKVLEKYRGDGELSFSWKHLADRLELVRCTFSGSAVELRLDPCPVNQWRPYGAAKHRLFMSASVNDGSALIRELGCSIEALERQILAGSDRGPGERMILTTSLVDPQINDSDIATLASDLTSITNVVVLVSSESQSRVWTSAGARYVSGGDVSRAIKELRSSLSGNFIVMAQRYDGVDLPDDACRLLIIHGVPQGGSLSDRSDQASRPNVAGTRNRIVNRLEQGLGRAVRSPVDYSAVLLVGRELGAFVGNRQTQALLSPATARQLEMSRELSKLAGGEGNHLNAIKGTILQCLRRDPGWRAYYQHQISSVQVGENVYEGSLREIALAERTALEKALARDYTGASSALNGAVNATVDDEAAAALMESMARHFYQTDKATAHEVQQKAYARSSSVSRPVGVLPARLAKSTTQSENVKAKVGTYSYANAAIAELETLRSRIAYSNHYRIVEAGLHELGIWIGADSSRPDNETDRGPDVLWRFGDRAFVIEAKSENHTSLHKTDAAQLLLSGEWVKEFYPTMQAQYLVIASDTKITDSPTDFSFGASLMTEAIASSLIDRVKGFAMSAIAEGNLFKSNASVLQGHLVRHKLLPDDLLSLLLRLG